MALEEQLRPIEGSKAYGSIDQSELCLVSNVVVLKKFKILEFKKYSGATNPRTYITGYCREMTKVAYDDK